MWVWPASSSELRMGRIDSTSSRSTPSEMPRLGLGSASMATTWCPRRARWRASAPDTVLLPEPPLPATAIFTYVPPGRETAR